MSPDPAGLSRRQFLFALSAGVLAGMQFEKFSGGSDPAVGANQFGFASSFDTPADLLAFVEENREPEPTATPTTTPTDPLPDPNELRSAVEPAPTATSTPEATTTDFELGHREIDQDDLAALQALEGEQPEPDPLEALTLSGLTLAGWQTVLGDSRFTAEGLATVNADDVATAHLSDRSVLAANRHGRGVMAQNTSYLRKVDDNALHMHHHASVEIRTPVTPERVSGLPNGQTAEVALFVWDGKATRRDIGLGLQWMINPWSDNFGALRTWVTNPDGTSNWSPEPVAWLEPTDEWQLVELTLDPITKQARVSIGGTELEAQCTETKKPDNWAYKTAASFAVELVSIWPGDRTEAPTTRLEARNWQWDWIVPV